MRDTFFFQNRKERILSGLGWKYHDSKVKEGKYAGLSLDGVTLKRLSMS